MLLCRPFCHLGDTFERMLEHLHHPGRPEVGRLQVVEVDGVSEARGDEHADALEVVHPGVLLYRRLERGVDVHDAVGHRLALHLHVDVGPVVSAEVRPRVRYEVIDTVKVQPVRTEGQNFA